MSIWQDFDPNTQKVIAGPDGPMRVHTAPQVVALRYIEPTEEEMDKCAPFETRIRRARELAAEGHVVDVQIDVWGWGAANTYKLRRMYGQSSVLDVAGRFQILTPPK